MSSSKFHKQIVILGESGVGKTCVTDRFLVDQHFVRYDPWNSQPFASEVSTQRTLDVDGQLWCLTVADLSTAPLRAQEPTFRTDIFDQILAHADGVILLYDITRKESYDYITNKGYFYVWDTRKTRRFEDAEDYLTRKQRFGCVLVGNKLDLADKHREVPKELAEEWADMQGLKSYEIDSYKRESIEEVMEVLVKSIKRAEKRDAEDIHRRQQLEKKPEHKDDETLNVEPVKATKGRSGLSKSLSKLKDALPNVRSKSKPTA